MTSSKAEGASVLRKVLFFTFRLWSRRKALVVNLISSLPFLAGGLLVWAASFQLDVAFLVPFAAGNFLYIAASDLIPEVNRHHRLATAALHFAAFLAGALLLLSIRIGLGS